MSSKLAIPAAFDVDDTAELYPYKKTANKENEMEAQMRNQQTGRHKHLQESGPCGLPRGGRRIFSFCELRKVCIKRHVVFRDETMGIRSWKMSG
jgi:hypothetical protein